MATPTSYQRVNTATDYDTTAHSTYLRFDGYDDYMLTNSIDFTGTDKMTVFAGVRKLSDAGASTLVELSNSDSNTGMFYIRAPESPTVRYSLLSKGSSFAIASTTNNDYLSPVTNILTGIGSISTDVSTLRINGNNVATSATNQGSGNYGNYPLYIGRRGGSSLPFNGRLYELIVRGAESTASEISNTETWMNQRTRAF